MKNYIVFVVLLFSYSCFSQKNSENLLDIKVLYEFNFKKFANSEDSSTANTILIHKPQEDIFAFEKMILLDSLQQFKHLEGSEVLLYRTPYFFLIKRNGKKVYHYESIGSELLKFDENQLLDWKLVNEEKLIGNYRCKKAILSFSGRNWIAWYTTEIPINSGPYKFFGLPGLIINIRDQNKTFEFTAIEIERGNYHIDSKIENYFISEKDRKFQNIEKDKFYKFRNTFYEMSLNERLKYMNREKPEGSYSFEIKSTTGEKPRTNRKSKERNFIELRKE